MNIATIFTSHMVFQANRPIKVFGEGRGNVRIEFLNEVKEYNSDSEAWCVTLGSYEYGGPYEMKVFLDGELIVLDDIYVGEVWIASGQSNMEMPLFRTEYGIDAAKQADNNKIRMFTVPKRTKRDTQLYGWFFENTDGSDTPWKVCTQETALHFSAIAYYVAKEIQEKLGVAVGIISCNYGGHILESAISPEYLQNHPAFVTERDRYNEMMEQLDFEKYMQEYNRGLGEWEEYYHSHKDIDEVLEVGIMGPKATNGTPKNLPQMPVGPYSPAIACCIYNAMFARIVPFSVRGMLWYHGEIVDYKDYSEQFLAFEECMRENFQNSDMPFYMVEVAGCVDYWHENPQDCDDRFVETDCVAFTRQAQYKAAKKGRNTYIATSMGETDIFDIHPVNKKMLAHRLALKVLKYEYNKDVDSDQPVFKQAVFENGKVKLYFENADGLFSPFPDRVKMYVADENKVLKRAKIIIEEDNSIILQNPEIRNPKYASFAFDNYYSGALIYNKAGLPIAPFRAENV